MKNAFLSLIAAIAIFIVYKFAYHPATNTNAPLPPAAEAPNLPPPPPQDPPIVEAVQASLRDAASKSKIAELLAQGADPNAIDKSGRTVLSLAVRNDDAPAVELLLAKGADANKRDREMQWTPLMNAAFQAARDPRYLPIVELLLKKGADANAAKDGTTALHVAVNNIDAKSADAKVIEVLTAGGALPDGPAVTGPNTLSITPLSLAAWNGKMAAAVALARAGANLGAPRPGAKTAAQTARDNKHPELAAALEKIAAQRTAQQKTKTPSPAERKKAIRKKHR